MGRTVGHPSSRKSATREDDVKLEKPTRISLGGFGPSLREQGFAPFLGEDETDHFDRDDQAITRLHVRGLITRSQHIAARERLAKKVRAAFAKAEGACQ